MNLDTLRKKRIKRLGIKTSTYTGQRRIFFILDRATRKFHGDLGLWAQYIEFARQQKAHKKISKIFTDALRIHPTDAELWILAAKYALEDHADMTLARSYMQRGLRFCKTSKNLWIQYAKLEIIYIAKIAARQVILGLGQTSDRTEKKDSENFDTDADTIALPQLTGEDVNPSLSEDQQVDENALETLNSTPALSGAIPMAIFDASMKQFQNEPSFAKLFFMMVVEFENLSCLQNIINHIVDVQLATSPENHQSQICFIRAAVAGCRVDSPEFPRKFRESFTRFKGYPLSGALATEMIKWMEPLEKTKGLDPSLQTVLTGLLQRCRDAL